MKISSSMSGGQLHGGDVFPFAPRLFSSSSTHVCSLMTRRLRVRFVSAKCQFPFDLTSVRTTATVSSSQLMSCHRKPRYSLGRRECKRKNRTEVSFQCSLREHPRLLRVQQSEGTVSPSLCGQTCGHVTDALKWSSGTVCKIVVGPRGRFSNFSAFWGGATSDGPFGLLV